MKIERLVLLQELERLSGRLYEIARSDFEGLSAEQLYWKPQNRVWSIAQNLQHIYLFQQHYLPFIEKTINTLEQKGGKAAPYYQTGLLSDYLLRRVQLNEGNQPRQSLKTLKRFRPNEEQNNNPALVFQAYQQQEKALKLIFERVQALNLMSGFIPFCPLPFIGLYLGDALCLLVYHHERHIVQAQKLRTEELFPRTLSSST